MNTEENYKAIKTAYILARAAFAPASEAYQAARAAYEAATDLYDSASAAYQTAIDLYSATLIWETMEGSKN